MKIAFFNYLPLEYGGGMATFFLTVANTLKKKNTKLQISIIVLDGWLLYWINFFYSFYYGKNIYPKTLRTSDHINDQLLNITYIKLSSLQDLKKNLQSYDVIYSKNDLLEVGILKLLNLNKNKPRLVIGFHTPIFYTKISSLHSFIHNLLYNSILYRWLLQNTFIFHVLNNFDYRLIKKRFPFKKIYKIYNPTLHKNKIIINQKTNSEKHFHILWVGRLTEQKGIKDLINIILSLNTLYFQNKLVWDIAGDGELKSTIDSSLCNELNVNFHGYSTLYTLKKLYSQANLFISTSKWEGLPYNLLDAQSYGLPIIGYNIPGVSDIVIHKKNGLLVNNIDEFKKGISLCLNKQIQFWPPEVIYSNFVKKFNNNKTSKKLFKLFAL